MVFNENSRVKIPAILHLCRLGYSYVSLKNAAWDGATNIFPKILAESLKRINPDMPDLDPKRILDELSLALDGDDLGKAFYDKLAATSGIRLIDLEKPENNSWHVVTELPCVNGDDEFRPDITLLINGLPLVFIEVKKPNNRDGVIAERERINARFKNKKFKKFINATQLMVFSNNMEYDGEALDPIQGAFYATTARKEASFNYFREEDSFAPADLPRDEDDGLETTVLLDNNLAEIKHSPEFVYNKNPTSPPSAISSCPC